MLNPVKIKIGAYQTHRIVRFVYLKYKKVTICPLVLLSRPGPIFIPDIIERTSGRNELISVTEEQTHVEQDVNETLINENETSTERKRC